MFLIKNKLFLSIIFVILIIFGLYLLFENFNNPTLAFDFSKDSGLNKTAIGDNKNPGAGYSTTGLFSTIPGIAGAIIGAILSLLGVIFLGLMIYGGYTWMMARGNEQKVDKAKQIIISATIGLVIVVSAYAITAFIGSKLQ
jgi:hypothetical protein